MSQRQGFTHSATTMALLRAALLASLTAACSAAPVTKAMKNFGHSIKQAPLPQPARPLCN